MTDGAQSYGLDKLNRPFERMDHGLRELHLCVCIQVDKRKKKLMINWKV